MRLPFKEPGLTRRRFRPASESVHTGFRLLLGIERGIERLETLATASPDLALFENRRIRHAVFCRRAIRVDKFRSVETNSLRNSPLRGRALRACPSWCARIPSRSEDSTSLYGGMCGRPLAPGTVAKSLPNTA